MRATSEEHTIFLWTRVYLDMASRRTLKEVFEIVCVCVCIVIGSKSLLSAATAAAAECVECEGRSGAKFIC
jgi:hypothetical protein